MEDVEPTRACLSILFHMTLLRQYKTKIIPLL